MTILNEQGQRVPATSREHLRDAYGVIFNSRSDADDAKTDLLFDTDPALEPQVEVLNIARGSTGAEEEIKLD